MEITLPKDQLKAWLRDQVEEVRDYPTADKIYKAAKVMLPLIFIVAVILPRRAGAELFLNSMPILSLMCAVALLLELSSHARKNLGKAAFGILVLPFVGIAARSTAGQLIQSVSQEDPSHFPNAVNLLTLFATGYWMIQFLFLIFAILGIALFSWGILEIWTEGIRKTTSSWFRRLKKYLDVQERLELGDKKSAGRQNSIPRAAGAFAICAMFSFAALPFQNAESLRPWIAEILVQSEFSNSHQCTGISETAKVSSLGGNLISVAIWNPETGQHDFRSTNCNRD